MRKNVHSPRLYTVWVSMRDRCNRPANVAYADYGGRGITVCAEWAEYSAFERWALASGYTESLTIERVDNDAGYSPENCTWVTRRQQALNRRSSTSVTAFGETKTIEEWVEDVRCSVTRTTLTSRLRKMDWAPEKAISAPSGGRTYWSRMAT